MDNEWIAAQSIAVINARHSKDNEALIQQANHFHPAKHHVRCVEAPAWPLHIVPTFAAHAIPLAAADMAAIFSGFGYSTFLQVRCPKLITPCVSV